MAARCALFIGNSNYEDPTLSQLRTPATDVGRLAAVIRNPDIGGFDEVRELIDESEAAVRRAIAEFFWQKGRDDLLLLYFSGHGIKDDQGRLFLAVRDTAYKHLKATAIPSSYVTECMDECRSRRQILVLDCCNSGAFARGTKGDPTALTRTTFEGSGYGRAVLTASDATQYALEGDRVIEQAELSLFTHYLLEGLTTGEAAREGEDTITLDDWYEYAFQQIVSRTPAQTPRKWVYNQQGALIIAKNPAPRPAPAKQLPEELRASLDDSRPWVREGAVRELHRLLSSGEGMEAIARAALEHIAEQDDSLRVRNQAREALSRAPALTPEPARPAPPPVPAPAQEPARPAPAPPPAPAARRSEAQAAEPKPVPPANAADVAIKPAAPVVEPARQPEPVKLVEAVAFDAWSLERLPAWTLPVVLCLTGAAGLSSLGLGTNLPWTPQLLRSLDAIAASTGLWLAWRRRAPLLRPQSWLLVSTIVSVLVGASWSVLGFRGWPLDAALLGLGLGIVQSQLLRKHMAGAWRWMAASSAGWLVALPLRTRMHQLMWGQNDGGLAFGNLVDAIAAGLALAVVSFALARGMRLRATPHPAPAQQAPDPARN
jgi:hypothetical protein